MDTNTVYSGYMGMYSCFKDKEPLLMVSIVRFDLPQDYSEVLFGRAS